jgi:hypothetical protein
LHCPWKKNTSCPKSEWNMNLPTRDATKMNASSLFILFNTTALKCKILAVPCLSLYYTAHQGWEKWSKLYSKMLSYTFLLSKKLALYNSQKWQYFVQSGHRDHLHFLIHTCYMYRWCLLCTLFDWIQVLSSKDKITEKMCGLG